MKQEKAELPLLKELFKTAPTKRFQKGDIVIDLDEKMEGIPFVKSGLLKVYKEDDNDNEIFLYYLKPGEICSMGIKCCLSQGVSLTRVYSEEESEVVFISKETVLEQQTNPEWINFVVESLTQRIEKLLEVADDLAFKKLDERVLGYLQKKESLSGSKTINLTHKEISLDLNSSREVISRVLKKLEKEGLLSHHRNEINLL